jgi:fermentation-respiration switch protein FrsA (DUF1100 family)
MRWTARLIMVAIVGAALALIVAIVGFGLLISAPARATIGAPPTDLAAEPVALSSPSGATLRGWYIAGRPGRGAVVLMHGVHANRLSMVPRARFLSAAGFSILLFDLQAHGESTGDHITFGHLEGLDAGAAVAYLRQRLPAERIGVIGTSLGGAAALLGPGPLPVDALVLESVYSEIGAATSNRVAAVLGHVLGRTLAEAVARPAAWLFQLVLPPFLGVSPNDLRPIDRVAGIGAPVLIAAGTLDDRTTIAESAAMFDRARDPKLFWRVEGAGHVDLEAYAPDEYRKRVLAFFSETLQRR